MPWIVCLFLFLASAAEPKENGPDKPKYNLSICATFKNESRYLREWIEYHRLIGVDHFFLYDIGSSDGYKPALRKYLRDGVVTLINWPDLSKNLSDAIGLLSTQLPAYENAIRVAARGKTKWLVFVDVDEFLVPLHTDNLIQILEKYKDFPAVLLTREFFDASQPYVLPKRKLIIESLDMTESPEPSLQKSVEKMIFKPELCESLSWPPYRYTFKYGHPIALSKSEAKINSYLNRNQSLADSRRIKPKIKTAAPLSEKEIQHLLESGYEIEDPEKAIIRFVPEVMKRIGTPHRLSD